MSNSKSVAKSGNKNISKEMNFTGYMGKDYDDGVDNTDLIMPRVKIVQGTTQDKMGGKAGDFVHTINGVLGGEIEFFILLTWKSRILFAEDLGIKCRAVDGKVANQGEFAGTECEKCKLSKWDGNKKPQCSLIYNYAITLKGELLEAIKTNSILPPTTLSLMSSSTKVAKFINTNIRINRGRNKPIWADMINMTTELRKFDVGEAYLPVAKVGKTVGKKKVADYLHSLRETYIKMGLHTKLNEDDVINEAKESNTDNSNDDVMSDDLNI